MDKYHMSVEDNVFYAKRNIIDSIWKEANIEGIDVTYPDTQEVFEGRVVSGLTVDETVAINNLKNAWRFILDNIDAEVNLAFIRQVNGIIGAGLYPSPGDLRIGDVSIGGTSWKPDLPDFDNVTTEIAEIMSQPASTDRSIDMLSWICRSQLFYDGNKRTAQLVANAMLIQNGNGILAIPVEEKHRWAKLLIDYYETNDSRKLKDFLKSTSLDGIDIPDKPARNEKQRTPQVKVDKSSPAKDVARFEKQAADLRKHTAKVPKTGKTI